MAKKKKSKNAGWGIDLDLDLPEVVADSWNIRGFDVEEFFVPDVEADNFRVDGVDDEERKEEEDVEHGCRYVRPVCHPVPRRTVKYEKAVTLAHDLGLLSKGDRVDAIISGKFIMGDFIEAYMVEHNIHTKRLLISTLSYNENNVDSLLNLLDGGYVDTLDIVVSPYFFAHERNTLIRYTYEQLDNEQNRLQLAVAPVHTKTYQFITDDGRHLIFHGSANMRANANFENMIFEESEEVYRFYDDFYSEILREYPTIIKERKFSRDWFQPVLDDMKEGGH